MGRQATTSIFLLLIMRASFTIALRLPATEAGPATCLVNCVGKERCVKQEVMSETSEPKFICTSNLHSYNPCAYSPSPCAPDYNCFVEKPQNATPSAAVCLPSCKLVDCPPGSEGCFEIANKFGYKEATCVPKSCQDACQTAGACQPGFECKVIGCKAKCVQTHPAI